MSKIVSENIACALSGTRCFSPWVMPAFAALGLMVVPTSSGYAQAPPLGVAASYAVIAGTTVTNTGPSVLNGDLAISPGAALVGSPPGTVTGFTQLANPAAVAAQ